MATTTTSPNTTVTTSLVVALTIGNTDNTGAYIATSPIKQK